MSEHYEVPPLRQSALRILTKLAFVLVAVWVIHRLMGWIFSLGEAAGGAAALMGGIIFVALLTYAALIAVPFVPGVEIGISLMILRGSDVAPFVYVATVAGLLLAFSAGRFMPYDWLFQFFLDLRMTRAAELMQKLKPLSRERRLALLRRQMPRRIGDFLVDYRYVALAILLNLPGNALIGGGGGICLVAGLSRVYTARATLLTIAIAVAPVPAVVWFFGIDILS